MKKLIVISDWADDSLYSQELATAISGFLNDPGYPHISFIKATNSSINIAYLLKTIVDEEERVGRPLETVILQVLGDFSLDAFTIIRLKSGLYLLGSNKEFSYSMIKDYIEEMFTYPGLQQGKNFRPMDVYARVTAHLIESKQDDMELDEAHSNTIPELEGDYVGHINSTGQMQTTIQEFTFKTKYQYGQEVIITINGISKIATYVESEPEEETMLTVYPSKMSHPDSPYLEISGTSPFEDPQPGMKVAINGV